MLSVRDLLNHPPAACGALWPLPPTGRLTLFAGNDISGPFGAKEGGSSVAPPPPPSLPADSGQGCSPTLEASPGPLPFPPGSPPGPNERMAARSEAQEGLEAGCLITSQDSRRRASCPLPGPGIHFLTKDVDHIQVTHRQSFSPPPARHPPGSEATERKRGSREPLGILGVQPRGSCPARAGRWPCLTSSSFRPIYWAWHEQLDRLSLQGGNTPPPRLLQS